MNPAIFGLLFFSAFASGFAVGWSLKDDRDDDPPMRDEGDTYA